MVCVCGAEKKALGKCHEINCHGTGLKLPNQAEDEQIPD